MAFLDFVQRQIKDSPGAIPIMLAHNMVGFDHKVMAYNFSLVGLQWPDEWMYMDSVVIARSFRKQNRLVSILRHIKLPSQ